MKPPSRGVTRNDGGDVFATLRWGLRRYAWVVALFVVGLAALVPTILNRAPDQYEAQAQVGPTEGLDLPNLDPLPRLGTTVFNNGAVADAVRESVEPALPRSVRVIPDRVDLVAAQDNIVFVVVGRGSTPESASRLTNIAAAAFTEELNQYADSVGSFAIQHLAEPPGQAVAGLTGAMTTGIGLLAGLAGGVGAVALILVIRRPVLDAATAESVAGAPVLGRVRLTGTRGGFEGLPRLARRVHASAVDIVLLAGTRATRRARRLLPAALGGVLHRPFTVVPQGDGHGVPATFVSAGKPTGEASPLLFYVDPTQTQVTTRPDNALTVLVVREGISQAALRRHAENSLDDGSCGIVLVHGLGRGLHVWRSQSTRSEDPPPPPEPAPSTSNGSGPVRWYARD